MELFGTGTDFLYDGLALVQELAGTTPSANLLTGLGIDETLTRTVASGTSTLLGDALGSTLALTDGLGAVQTSYTYDPFGVTTQSGTPSANAAQYTGRENDGTGLYYYRFRYYSPGLQQFVSEDPILTGGAFNLYSYVLNNPMKWRDPLGLFADDPKCKEDPLKYKDGVPPASADLAKLLRCIQDCVGSPIRVTSTSEAVPVHPGTSPHGRSVAADIGLIPGVSGAQVMQCGADCGAGFGQDETGTKSHSHVQLPPGTKGGAGDLPKPRKPKDKDKKCECK